MKKKINGLVLQSYNGDQLDPEIVDLIANRLSREELKQYIKLLKHYEYKKHVIVTVPQYLSKEQQTIIQKLFINKEILYTIDPTIVSGIKIVDNDMEYELSINQLFQDLVRHLIKLSERFSLSSIYFL